MKRKKDRLSEEPTTGQDFTLKYSAAFHLHTIYSDQTHVRFDYIYRENCYFETSEQTAFFKLCMVSLFFIEGDCILHSALSQQPIVVDNDVRTLYTAEQVKAIAEKAVFLALQQATISNLENNILESMPQEGETNVARLKERVQLDNGVVKWASGNNKQELFRCIARVIMGPQVDPKKIITLRDFVEQKYKPTYFKTLAETTKANYEQYLRLNIYPFLGDMYLTDIDVLTIQNFYNWMAEAGSRGRKNDLNKHTIDRVSGFLSRILRIAVALKYIDESPINRDLLKNNGKKASNHKPLRKADINIVRNGISVLKLERQRLFIALLAYTGMRPEEILGLRWDCVDLENGLCHMIRTVTYPDKIKALVQEGGKTELSVRQINLVPDVITILSQVEDRTGYVIHGRDKMSPCPRSTYVKTYSEAFKQLGIKGYEPYDFRTNFATECCEAGFTAKQTADMMGHADTRMVEKVYAKRRSEGVIQYREALSHMMTCDKECDIKTAV